MSATLSCITAEVAVVGASGDLLFPFALQTELHRALCAAGVRSSLWHLPSEVGHDAFLVHADRLAERLRQTGLFAAGDPTLRAPELVPLRRLRVGLGGCGVVGQGVLELLDRQRANPS